MALAIRHAKKDDIPLILELVRDLAIYEREPEAAKATAEDLRRDGFGETPAFHVLIAELDGAAVGFALYFFTYSTWRGRRCLYLEDLFVRPEQRGKGTGIALMRALAREAVGQECARFVWQVLDWNQPSIDFYERLGARVERQWLHVRLEGEALTALARS